MPDSTDSETNDKLGLYSGQPGLRYHLQREGSRAEDGQRRRARYFADITKPSDVVLDFGCGTGAILANLPSARRIGIEINEFAAAEARKRLDTVYPSLGDVPQSSVDAAISFHAMEHVPNPYEVLCEISKTLKHGAKFRLILPYDNVLLNSQHRHWTPNDKDMHLFCWTPLHIGNLLTAAGFQVTETKLSPMSQSLRLARWFRWAPGVAGAAEWLKSVKCGNVQVIATCIKP